MTSPVLHEGWYSGGFLVSEGPNYQSRDVGTLLNSGTADITIDAGMVLSPHLGTIAVTAAGTNGATGTVGSISLGAGYIPGNYSLKATSATVFSVTDPTGRSMPAATVGAAYTDAEINFTVTAGTGTYAAGDAFTVAVPSPSGTFEPTGTASLPATAVLFSRIVVPAGGSKKATIIARQAEVNTAELQWDATILNAGTLLAGLEATAIKQLGSVGILAR